jgi:IS605 OrfB family transposase
MRRSTRVYLNDLNVGKHDILVEFLRLVHDVSQYFVDLFWQRKDFSSKLADLETVHRACKRFGITTRLAQACAKQAKETIVSQRKKEIKRKPRLRKHIFTACQHFVKVTPYDGDAYDFMIEFIGSGAPWMKVPVHSTYHLNKFLANGWKIGNSIRLGRRKNRIWIDFILEKVKPVQKKVGKIIGMDSNYKNGLVFSDGQMIAKNVYDRIQTFGKRQKNTKTEIKNLFNKELKKVDLSDVDKLVIENLKNVKKDTRGKFPRKLNRRMSHWLYAYIVERLTMLVEEAGSVLIKKHPAYTSQYCSVCNKWDKRNRKGDVFRCKTCGHEDHADINAAKNLQLLGEAGSYGIRSLQTKLTAAVKL